LMLTTRLRNRNRRAAHAEKLGAQSSIGANQLSGLLYVREGAKTESAPEPCAEKEQSINDDLQ